MGRECLCIRLSLLNSLDGMVTVMVTEGRFSLSGCTGREQGMMRMIDMIYLITAMV